MKTPNIIRLYWDQLRLTWRLFKDRRVSLWMKGIGVLPVLYLIFPIDLIPDFIPVLGQMDDLAILYAGMRLFETIVPAHIVKEHRAALALRDVSSPTPPGVVSGRATRKE